MLGRGPLTWMGTVKTYGGGVAGSRVGQHAKPALEIIIQGILDK